KDAAFSLRAGGERGTEERGLPAEIEGAEVEVRDQVGSGADAAAADYLGPHLDDALGGRGLGGRWGLRRTAQREQGEAQGSVPVHRHRASAGSGPARPSEGQGDAD